MAFQQAQSYLQGMPNPFDGVLQAYGQGQTLRQNRDLLQAQQAEQARKMQAQQQLETLDWSNQNDIAKVVAQFPEYTKGAQDYYNNMEAKEQKAYLASSAKVMAAIDSGRVDIAVQSLRDEADVYREMGDDVKADERSDLAASIARDPKGMRKAIAMAYAVNAPKDAASSYKSMVDADIAENESPYNINETIAKTNKTYSESGEIQAKTDAAVAESMSNAAITQDPSYFSLRIGQIAARGLISPAEEEFLGKLMTDEPEKAAGYLRNIAKGNPEIAKAFIPELKYVDAGDTVEAMAYDPLTGEVTNQGSIAKGVNPTTQYTADKQFTASIYGTDANERGNIRTNAQSDTNSQRSAQTAANAQAIQAAIAQQNAEIAKGEVTRQVMPDGRVLLFNKQGQWKPVIDTDGKPMISKPSAADKPLNESQANSLMYGKRMQTANKILNDLEANGTTRAALINGVPLVGGVAANIPLNPFGNSENQRKYEQAQRNFINAVLRKESGAAIGDSEFASAKKQYFPTIGDSEAVIKQKAANRKQVTTTMLSNAGAQGQAQVKKSTAKVKTNDLF